MKLQLAAVPIRMFMQLIQTFCSRREEEMGPCLRYVMLVLEADRELKKTQSCSCLARECTVGVSLYCWEGGKREVRFITAEDHA